jgi:drug/metabolite transporter (DMT)-like permease
MTKREWLLTMAAGCCLGLHFSAFFESLRHTSIASAVILSDAEVLFVALGSILVFRKKLSRQCWLAVILSLIGAVMVALADGGGESGLLGNALALTSTFLLALYTMIGASVRSRISNTTYTFVAYGCAAITVLVLSLIGGTPLIGYGVNNWLTALGMAVLCTLMGHSVFTWGLKYLPPAYISTVKLLDPVFSALWGLLLFQETPTLPVILGGVIVIVGVFIYGRATEEE